MNYHPAPHCSGHMEVKSGLGYPINNDQKALVSGLFYGTGWCKEADPKGGIEATRHNKLRCPACEFEKNPGPNVALNSKAHPQSEPPIYGNSQRAWFSLASTLNLPCINLQTLSRSSKPPLKGPPEFTGAAI